MNENGVYPEDSINFKAVARLKEISDLTHEDDKDAAEEGA
jgi:hypothetical protein